jgi:uncharacterized protein YndB with AHSA1/START domain
VTAPIDQTADQIREEMVLRTPPAQVWRALTRPEELLAWWGDPSVYQCTRWVLDPIAGSRWRAEGTNAAGGAFSVGGTVLEAVPPSLLAYTWEPSWIEVPATTVRITLDPVPEGTRLVWVHSGFTRYPRALQDHRGGLPSVLGWLRRYLGRDESPRVTARSMPGPEEPAR